MAYQHIVVPPQGEKIKCLSGQGCIPDHPIIAFIEGDGIGRDIMTASRRVWDAAVAQAYGGKRQIAWMEIYAGEKAAKLYGGDYLPAETFDALREFLVGIKGPLTTPVGGGFRSLNVTLRQVLDLYACVRPVKWYRGVPSPLKQPELVDVVDEMLVAGEQWLPQYKEAIEAAKGRLSGGKLIPTKDGYAGAARLHTKTVDEMAADREKATKQAGEADKAQERPPADQ